MRVAVDLDDVIYPWTDTARAMLREYHKIEVPPAQTWTWIRDHVTPDKWNWLWTEGVDRGLFRHGALSAGAEPALRQLAQIGDLVVVTARPESARWDTYAWLSRYKIPVNEVHVVAGRPKSTVRADLYIDDSPHVIADLIANTTAHVVCYAHPWNDDLGWQGRRYRRFSDWRDIVGFAGEVKDASETHRFDGSQAVGQGLHR